VLPLPTVTDGVSYAHAVLEELLGVLSHTLMGYMRIESLNREKGTSKFIFQVGG
jgi:hypothetical protein